MTGPLLRLPAHLRLRLAAAIETGQLPLPCSPMALRSVLGSRLDEDELLGTLEHMSRLGIVGKGAAALLQAIESTSSQVPRPDLVWSGPEAPGVHARDTRQVVEELFLSAQRSVWASSYVYFDGQRAFETLARRMEACPSLQVTLLLNIQRGKGVTTAADELVRRYADKFWGMDWPGFVRPRVYYDPRSLELDGPTGVLHAKAIVMDDEAVFVTSANLTEAAFDRNIELGLLIRERALAGSVSRHFQVLIDRELLRPLPGA
jgi:phosphatidylserine/phosphatidylglycerophosphate/cardiolipin synthase-like enzyme